MQIPKYLVWPDSNRIDQTYSCEFDTLLTSGCSFTSSTTWFDGAASWPGYVRDRCKINRGIDMSWPGVGNLFIANSIKYALENICDRATEKILVVVMWSGLNRLENIVPSLKDPKHPMLGGNSYVRISNDEINPSLLLKNTKESLRLILDLAGYLDQRKVAWAFTFYSNLLFPPFIPKRDGTHHFTDYLNKNEIDQIRSINWVPKNNMDYLYEWAFVNDYLNEGDRFHPPNEANAAWTDRILLPHLHEKNLINPVCPIQYPSV